MADKMQKEISVISSTSTLYKASSHSTNVNRTPSIRSDLFLPQDHLTKDDDPIGELEIDFRNLEDPLPHYALFSSGGSSSVSTVLSSITDTRTPSYIDFRAPSFGIERLKLLITLPIPDEYIQKICFTETLVISKECLASGGDTEPWVHPQLVDAVRSQEVGAACISVENVRRNLITYCTTQFSLTDGAVTSSLLSTVNKKLDLVEETKTESLYGLDRETDIQERSLHVYKSDNKCVAFRRIVEDGMIKDHRGEVSLSVSGNLILDGGNIALMRYLILSNFTGTFETWCMHISGEICRCVYNVGKQKMLMIKDTPHKMIRIVRTVHRFQRRPDVTKIYFLPTGHIARQKWKDCDYFLHMNPLSFIPPPPYVMDLEKNWMHDIQLFSEYIDYKEKETKRLKDLIRDETEFRDIIKDYVICLLQLKPQYPLDFTIDYFKNLTCDDDNIGES